MAAAHGTLEERLWKAANTGQVETVRECLRQPRLDIMWGNPSSFLNSPLHAAAFHGLVEIIRLLLGDPRVDVNRRNIRGNTPLNLATWNAEPEAVRVLLQDPRVDTTIKSHTGGGPLWSGTHSGRLEVIQWLLVSEKELNVHDPVDFMDWDTSLSFTTTLELAAMKNHFHISSLLGDFVRDPARTRAQLRRVLRFPGTLSPPSLCSLHLARSIYGPISLLFCAVPFFLANGRDLRGRLVCRHGVDCG